MDIMNQGQTSKIQFVFTLHSILVRYSLVLLLGLFSSSFSLAQDQEAQATATPTNQAVSQLDITVATQGPEQDTLIAGQPFEWEIQVRWYGEVGDLNPEIQKSPSWTGLDLLKPSTTIRTGADGERRFSEKVFRFTLRPKTQGEASIGSSTLRYNLPGDEKEHYLNTTPATFTIQAAPFSLRIWLSEHSNSKVLWGGLILLGILLILSVTLVLRRRYKKAVIEEPVEVANPVEEAFERARRSRIEGDRSRLIRGLKEAIQCAFSQQYPEVNSSDLSAYRDRLEFGLQLIFDRFVEQSEHIQFAPVSPTPDELDRIVEDARRLTGLK